MEGVNVGAENLGKGTLGYCGVVGRQERRPLNGEGEDEKKEILADTCGVADECVFQGVRVWKSVSRVNSMFSGMK